MMSIPFDMIAAIVLEFGRSGEEIVKQLSSSPEKTTSTRKARINFDNAYSLCESGSFYGAKFLNLPSDLLQIESSHVIMPSPKKQFTDQPQSSANGCTRIAVLPGLQFKMQQYKIVDTDNYVPSSEFNIGWLSRNKSYRSKSLSERHK